MNTQQKEMMMKYAKYGLIDWIYVAVGVLLILAIIELSWQVF